MCGKIDIMQVVDKTILIIFLSNDLYVQLVVLYNHFYEYNNSKVFVTMTLIEHNPEHVKFVLRFACKARSILRQRFNYKKTS